MYRYIHERHSREITQATGKFLEVRIIFTVPNDFYGRKRQCTKKNTPLIWKWDYIWLKELFKGYSLFGT